MDEIYKSKNVIIGWKNSTFPYNKDWIHDLLTLDEIREYNPISFELRLYQEENIEEITFVGLCTDICVISNALILKAEFYNIGNITVVADACAGVTPEKHEAALEVMRSCQINVI